MSTTTEASVTFSACIDQVFLEDRTLKIEARVVMPWGTEPAGGCCPRVAVDLPGYYLPDEYYSIDTLKTPIAVQPLAAWNTAIQEAPRRQEPSP